MCAIPVMAIDVNLGQFLRGVLPVEAPGQRPSDKDPCLCIFLVINAKVSA